MLARIDGPSGRIIKDRIDTAVSEHLLTHVAHQLEESLRYLRGEERKIIEEVVRFLDKDLGLSSVRPWWPTLAVPFSDRFCFFVD